MVDAFRDYDQHNHLAVSTVQVKLLLKALEQMRVLKSFTVVVINTAIINERKPFFTSLRERIIVTNSFGV